MGLEYIIIAVGPIRSTGIESMLIIGLPELKTPQCSVTHQCMCAFVMPCLLWVSSSLSSSDVLATAVPLQSHTTFT